MFLLVVICNAIIRMNGKIYFITNPVLFNYGFFAVDNGRFCFKICIVK